MTAQEQQPQPAGLEWRQRRAVLVIVLLGAQPVLSLAYLLGMRWYWLPPSFVAPVLLGVLPLVAGAVAVGLLRHGGHGMRIAATAVFLVCAAELGWSVLVAAMVGFAMALRSG